MILFAACVAGGAAGFPATAALRAAFVAAVLTAAAFPPRTVLAPPRGLRRVLRFAFLETILRE